MKRIVCLLFSSCVSLVVAASTLVAETPVALVPASPYDRSGIYLNLVIFWLGIIGVIVLVRMKLREVERIQEMEEAEGANEPPVLE